jgi:hypothetical protein
VNSAAEKVGANGKSGLSSGGGSLGGKVKMAGTAGKAALIATLTSLTGVPPAVWALALSKKALVAYAVVLIMPLVLLMGLLTSVTGGSFSQPASASNKEVVEYTPSNWQTMLVKTSRKTAKERVPVPWTILAGTAKAATDFGRTSPYDNPPVDHDKPRKTENVKDSPDPEAPLAAVPVDASAPAAVVPGANAASVDLNGSCKVRRSDPTIGGGTGQGTGPFLLTKRAVEDMAKKGRDPHNPCEAAEYLAGALADAANERVRAGADNPTTTAQTRGSDGTYAEPAENKAFWAAVIAESGLIQSAVGDCAVPVTAGEQPPVPFLIEQIWNCEIYATESLQVVNSVSGSGADLSYSVMTRSDAARTLVAEAQQVSYGFSKWELTGCDNTAQVAGVFPLTSQVASSYGAADRCDVQANIRAAARAVISVEKTDPKSRVKDMGPYQPMLGGWVNVAGALGAETADLARMGPSSVWSMPQSCVASVEAYAKTVAPFAGPLAGLGVDPSTMSSTDALNALNAAQAAAGVGTPSTSATCVGAPPSAFLEQAATVVQNVSDALYEASPETTPTPAPSAAPTTPGAPLPSASASPAPSASSSASPSTDPTTGEALEDTSNVVTRTPSAADQLLIDSLQGVSVALSFQARLEAPSSAVYGQQSLVGPRLARTSAPIPVGDTSRSSLATSITTLSEKAVDYAVFYGGLTRPFKSTLVRQGTLLATGGAGAVYGGAGGLAGDVPPELAALFIKFGAQCPMMSPALLAAQTKVESGWNPNARNSGSGASGLSQFMPATWKTKGVDGDGDGRADPFNASDAVASQASYMCELSGIVTKFGGDNLDLTLAAYNAGPGNVSKYKGIPPFKETQNYVVKIKGLMAQYSAPAAGAGIGVIGTSTTDAIGCPTAPGASRIAGINPMQGGSEAIGIAKLCADSVALARSPQHAEAIKWALNRLGWTYSQPQRAKEGYADCSSLISRAYTASGIPMGFVTAMLPGAKNTQKTSAGDLRPGDFYKPSSGHVVMVLAHGYIVHAPKSGDVVKVGKAYSFPGVYQGYATAP